MKMKTDNLIILGAAAVALFIISSTRKVSVPSGASSGRTIFNPFGRTAVNLNQGGTVPVTEINNATVPGDNGYGWRYFSDGTVIDPSGNYYVNGAIVWSPAGGQMGYGG